MQLFQGRKQNLYDFLFTLTKVAPLHPGFLYLFRRKITEIDRTVIPSEGETGTLSATISQIWARSPARGKQTKSSLDPDVRRFWSANVCFYSRDATDVGVSRISFKSWLMVSHKETIQQWQDGWVKGPYTSSELDSRPPVLSLVATS